ncbi:hypothetical protein G6F57_023167 [Rhizopus arrhizus]|nr:hypothetical protein G6F57_023167 [Rhizopus arrhizus]
MLAQAAALPDPDETARQLLVLIDGAIAVALVTGDLSITDSAERAAAALLPASAGTLPPHARGPSHDIDP